MTGSSNKVALAVVAHPDDIEFMMAGTLMRLADVGYRLHLMNVANGSCGSAAFTAEEIVAIREGEARAAAGLLGATLHPALVDDIEIYYERPLLRRLAALVREVNPEILLVQSLVDYMEDHINCARLTVTAAFCRGMRNFTCEPPCPPADGPLAVYHAMPFGLTDQLRHPVGADLYVDIGELLERKRQLLACHASQQEWLDRSQGQGSYLQTMERMARQVGAMSGVFEAAEGWVRHSHQGFGDEAFDPLTAALAPWVAAVSPLPQPQR